MSEQLNTYIFPASLILLFAVACLFSFRRRTSGQKDVIFLSLMYWVFFLALLIGYMNNTGLTRYVPHSFRTAHLFSLLFMPLSFLYVSMTFFPRKLRKADVLHFIPAILYLVDYSSFFLLPASEKLAVFDRIRNTPGMSDFGEGLIAPKGFHVAVRYMVMLGYFLAQSLVLGKVIRDRGKEATPSQASLLGWMKWLTVSQLVIILPPVLNLIFRFDIEIRVLNQFSGIIAAVMQGYFLLFRPEILYGWEGNPPNEPKDETISLNGEIRTRKPVNGQKVNSDSDDLKKKEWMDGLAEKLEEHLSLHRPYLRTGYNLPDLARELGCTTNQLSYLVNRRYGYNFNTLINHYRVEACKKKLAEEEYREKTLEAIARETGFQSRATFINAFKRVTGQTPSEFIRSSN